MIELPTDTPVTKPVPLTVATPGLTLVHAPPAVASVSDVAERLHRVSVPVMGAGCTFTVTISVAAQLPML